MEDFGIRHHYLSFRIFFFVSVILTDWIWYKKKKEVLDQISSLRRGAVFLWNSEDLPIYVCK